MFVTDSLWLIYRHIQLYYNYLFRCSSVLAALDVLSNTAVRCKQDLIRQRETLAETQQVLYVP